MSVRAIESSWDYGQSVTCHDRRALFGCSPLLEFGIHVRVIHRSSLELAGEEADGPPRHDPNQTPSHLQAVTLTATTSAMSSATVPQEPPSSSSSSAAPSSKTTPTTDPVLRNALRYTVSAEEYAALHKYILSRSRTLRRAAPSPASVDKALRPKKGKDDYNAKAVRHALRVFAVTWLGMKGWEVVERRVKNKE